MIELTITMLTPVTMPFGILLLAGLAVFGAGFALSEYTDIERG